jgi:quercetin dioxygenase-like cupin family protein
VRRPSTPTRPTISLPTSREHPLSRTDRRGDHPPARRGRTFQRANRVVTIKVDLPESSIHKIEFDPTFEVPAHTHEHVDAMLVLDGEIELLGDMRGRRVGPGAIVATPAGTQHGFCNPGPGRARLLIIHAPDGGFSAMVRAT